MKTLTDWFDVVYLINCPHRPDRLHAARQALTGLVDWDKVVVQKAVVGKWTTAPDGWGAGPGAWGCWNSHRRTVEDWLHLRDYQNNLKHRNFLVLEDDVFFLPDALENLNKFMSEVPDDWGQIYLGGQHHQSPERVSKNVILGTSVHRTHAYAVNAPTAEQFYRHISQAPDYFGTALHIDAHLERAHRRRFWAVYCPENWLCGQRAGYSDILTQSTDEKTWL